MKLSYKCSAVYETRTYGATGGTEIIINLSIDIISCLPYSKNVEVLHFYVVKSVVVSHLFVVKSVEVTHFIVVKSVVITHFFAVKNVKR